MYDVRNFSMCLTPLSPKPHYCVSTNCVHFNHYFTPFPVDVIYMEDTTTKIRERPLPPAQSVGPNDKSSVPRRITRCASDNIPRRFFRS